MRKRFWAVKSYVLFSSRLHKCSFLINSDSEGYIRSFIWGSYLGHNTSQFFTIAGGGSFLNRVWRVLFSRLKWCFYEAPQIILFHLLRRRRKRRKTYLQNYTLSMFSFFWNITLYLLRRAFLLSKFSIVWCPGEWAPSKYGLYSVALVSPDECLAKT